MFYHPTSPCLAFACISAGTCRRVARLNLPGVSVSPWLSNYSRKIMRRQTTTGRQGDMISLDASHAPVARHHQCQLQLQTRLLAWTRFFPDSLLHHLTTSRRGAAVAAAQEKQKQQQPKGDAATQAQPRRVGHTVQPTTKKPQQLQQHAAFSLTNYTNDRPSCSWHYKIARSFLHRRYRFVAPCACLRYPLPPTPVPRSSAPYSTLPFLVLQVLEARTQSALDHRAAVRDVRGRIPHGGAHLADEDEEDNPERCTLIFPILVF